MCICTNVWSNGVDWISPGVIGAIAIGEEASQGAEKDECQRRRAEH